MTCYECLLTPDNFDWADDVETAATKSLQSPLTTQSFLLQQEPQPEGSPIFVTKEIFWGEMHDLEEAESTTGSSISDYDTISIATAMTSDDGEIKETQPATTSVVIPLMKEVYNAFDWREYSVGIDRRIHHFNWLGEPVYQHSSTSPADSLAVILTDSKVPEASEDLRVQSLLRCAYTFLDPVVVDLGSARRHLLLRRGSQLQQAATGLTFKYYTPHGQWMTDVDEDPSEVVVDTGNVNAYITSKLAVGNGFVQPTQIRSSTEWVQARTKRLDALSRWQPPRRLQWKPRPSPLRQVMSASAVKPRLHKKPARELLRVTEEPALTLSNSLPPSLPPAFTSAPPSSHSSTPSTTSSRGLPPFARRSKPRTPSPTFPSPSTSEGGPSRDPDIYWSFPPPNLNQKPRKLKRALKKTFRMLLSIVRPRRMLSHEAL